MKKRNAGGEWTDTGWHRMSGTAIEERMRAGTAIDGITTTGTIDMIGTGITIDDTNITTGSIPQGTVSNGRNTADITTNHDKSTAIRRTITKNVISKKAVTHRIRNKELQTANQSKTPRLPQDLPRVQQTMLNPAIPGRPTATIADKKAIIVINARRRAMTNDRQ